MFYLFQGGKQEDAEEFLSFVLNGLHEEMAAAIKQVAQVNNVNDHHPGMVGLVPVPPGYLFTYSDISP